MTPSIIVWSLMLAAAPAWTQHPPEAKPVPAVAPAAAPKDATAAKPIAEKPAPPARATSAESAAERIMRRLDEAYPKGKTQVKTKGTTTAPSSTPAHPATPRSVGARTSGTSEPPRASHRVTLTWRITLHWPEEIAPTHQVK